MEIPGLGSKDYANEVSTKTEIQLELVPNISLIYS